MDLMQRRRVMLAAGKRPRLPREYQEVAWIENTGGQSINPNYIGTQSTSARAVFSVNKVVDNTTIVGGVTGSYVRLYIINLLYGGRLALGYNSTFTSSNYYIQLNQIYDVTATLSKGSQIVTVNGQEVINNNDNFDFTCPVWIFRRNSSAQEQLFGKIYLVEIYENGVLQRNLIPCYRKSDSKPGMYDIVNNVFYTNAGTGEFLVGPDVN